MRHALDLVHRIAVRGRVRRLDAAALVDRDVDDDGAALHRLEHRPRHQFRRTGAGNQYRADHDVGGEHFLLDRFAGREAGADAAFEHFIKLTQPRDRAVEDRNLGAESNGHPRRMGADHAAALAGDLDVAGRLAVPPAQAPLAQPIWLRKLPLLLEAYRMRCKPLFDTHGLPPNVT